MTTGGAPRRDGPVALSALFDEALRHLGRRNRRRARRRARTAFSTAATGTSVPRALFLDRRLTPLERNAWQVFRLQLNDDGVTAFPTYDQLAPTWPRCPVRRRPRTRPWRAP
jgi:hypothetical protein